MKDGQNLPTREVLDESFHFLHDQITRITVAEEAEMIKAERESETNE
ncbi:MULTISPECIES: hypothetical protein [unclassified Bacillus (in: firmicutes)]|nr:MULTISPECIES: hypothetical protein [unclassified Bacillus (in: firmicutes)]